MMVGDRLLLALSARREMSWAALKHAFDWLHKAEGQSADSWSLRLRRGEVVRALDSLGHAEFDSRSQRMRIVVTRPALAVLPGNGLPTSVLTGARSPESVERLSAAAQANGIVVDVQPQMYDADSHPSRISFLAEDPGQLVAFAQAQGLLCAATPPAWAILQLAGALQAYLDALLPEDLAGMNWEREDFDPETLRFSERFQPVEPCLSRYTHSVRRARLYVLHGTGSAWRVDPDWGRFAVLKAVRNDLLAYDENSSIFSAPVTVPLPKLLSRALCLCSGWAPSATAAGARTSAARLYYRIPIEVARIVAERLGQRLALRTITSVIIRRSANG